MRLELHLSDDVQPAVREKIKSLMAELETNPSLIDELVVDDSSVQRLFTAERLAIAERGFREIREGKYHTAENTECEQCSKRDPIVFNRHL